MIDEISYKSPPAPPLSQIDDIPPEQFCNGDNRPPDCGPNCMCTHTIDIPLNAIVEVVLVDEGTLKKCKQILSMLNKISNKTFIYSTTAKFVTSFPSSWTSLQCHWYGQVTR